MNIERHLIPELVVEGKRLGRNVNHDPRSLRYPFRAPTVQLVSKRWSTDSDLILDQGNLGSCTGNATAGALICSNGNPLHDALTADQVASLNEDQAVKFYSRATEIDPYEGTYKPTDTGSDGLSVAKAANQFGYISGYSHALSLNDALAALTTGPIIIGIGWYEGFDNPRSDGLVVKTGSLRGGHEICLDEIDVSSKEVWFRNSWSDGWGINGRACMLWDTLGALLDDDGDATVFTPNSVPDPTPPIPQPEPDQPLPTETADQKLYRETTKWTSKVRCYPPNERLRQHLIEWRTDFEQSGDE